MTLRPEPQDGFSYADEESTRCCPECLYDWDECECDELLDEDDHQPSEYDEWQDYFGGDDWDHGQFDEVW